MLIFAGCTAQRSISLIQQSTCTFKCISSFLHTILLSFLYSLKVAVVVRAALVRINVTSRRILSRHGLVTVVMSCRYLLTRRWTLWLLLAASYAGRVRHVVILMASTLLIWGHRRWLIDVSAADHLAAILLCLTRWSYKVWTTVRAHLPHILLIINLVVLVAIIVDYYRCHCPLLDCRRISFFLHWLRRIIDAYRQRLLSGCCGHSDWSCAGCSPCRGVGISLLLCAYGHLLLR